MLARGGACRKVRTKPAIAGDTSSLLIAVIKRRNQLHKRAVVPLGPELHMLQFYALVLFASNMQKIAEACFLVSTCAQKFSSQSHYCSGIKQSSSCFVIAYSQVSTGVSKGCIIEKCSILIGFHAELDAIVQLPTQLG